MNLKSDRELANTRAKLQRLEDMYRACEDLSEEPRVRELSMQSLKRLINQLKKEIALFETRRLVRRLSEV